MRFLLNLNSKKTLFLTLVSLVLFGIFAYFFSISLQRGFKDKDFKNSVDVQKTDRKEKITPQQSIKTEVRETGASLEIPEDVKTKAEEKTKLLESLPYSQKEFLIGFDFEKNKFVVTLSKPKSLSRQTFLDWLKTNYPNIPISEFVFK